MTTQTKALKLALEAADELEWMLRNGYEYGREGPPRAHRLITTIRSQPKEPEQEPVAMVEIHEFYENCAKLSLLQKLPKGTHNLYTTPPHRKPLTDEQRMIEMVDAAMVATKDIVPRITRSQCETIIRAAAHGIKE